MAYAKERGKFEKLAAVVAAANKMDEKSLAILIDSHEKYSHTLRILKNKNPTAFLEFYEGELQEIKAAKKAIKESETTETRQEIMVSYRELLLGALEKTIKTTTLV